MILDGCALSQIIIEIVSGRLGQFVLHVIHVDLGVADLDGLGDGVQPAWSEVYLREVGGTSRTCPPWR